jgi:hypothetical protein
MLVIISLQLLAQDMNSYLSSEDEHFPSGVIISMLFMCGGYFFLRDMIRMIVLTIKGQCFQAIRRDPMATNTAIMVVPLIYVAVTLTLHGYSTDLQSLSTCMAIAAGQAMLNFVVLLKNVIMDFAEFIDGLITVLQRIIAFMLLLGMVLLGYAQMLRIIAIGAGTCTASYNDDFTDDLEDPNLIFCYFDSSLLRFYTMAVGEVVEDDFEFSFFATVLYVMYLFSVVILLANILALIIGSQIYNTDRYALHFWLNRLDFIVEIESIVSSIGPLRYISKHDSFGERLMEDAYAYFFITIFQDKELRVLSPEFLKYTGLRIFSILVGIPLFIVLGLVTAGYFWPVAFRQRLFRVPEKAKSNQNSNGSSSSDDDTTTTTNGMVATALFSIKGEVDVLQNGMLSINEDLDSVQKNMQRIEDKLDTLLGLLKDKAS